MNCIVLQVPGATKNWPGVSAKEASEEQSHGGGIKRRVLKLSTVF